MLYKYGILLRFFPLKRFIPKLRYPEADNAVNKNYLTEDSIVGIVYKASKYILVRNKCLEKSIVIKFLLNKNRIKSRLVFGISKHSGKMLAHAWIKTDEKDIDLSRISRKEYTIINIIE